MAMEDGAQRIVLAGLDRLHDGTMLRQRYLGVARPRRQVRPERRDLADNATVGLGYIAVAAEVEELRMVFGIE